MHFLSLVKWKSLFSIFGAIVLFCLLIILFINWRFTRSYSLSKHTSFVEDVPSSQVAIIPGAAVYGKTPSPVLSDRLECGLNLYKAGKVKKLLLSGDNGKADYNELKPMLDYMLKNGVRPEDIFVDHAGFRTLDTLIRAKEVFQVKEAIFVSQTFFLARAIYLGNHLEITLHAFECNLRTYKKESYYTWRELFARQLAWWDILWDTPPKYLGDPFPIEGSGVKTWKGSIL
nr:ElyC/SanA/YdcF family protein [Leptospira idonii]